MDSTGEFCWICRQPEGPLKRFCGCKGSCAVSHQDCLRGWLETSRRQTCALCGTPYSMKWKTKPLREWTWGEEEVLAAMEACLPLVLIPLAVLMIVMGTWLLVNHNGFLSPRMQVVLVVIVLLAMIVFSASASYVMVEGPGCLDTCTAKNSTVTVNSIDEAIATQQPTKTDLGLARETLSTRFRRGKCRSCCRLGCVRLCCV
uniref:Immune evasion K3 protein n=1 Tax=Murine herpesvirus strain 4556 TaxID=338562 RepID=Q45NA9_MHV68|nr:immune evasion K3 protein [Murine herpesvirus strain 4556]